MQGIKSNYKGKVKGEGRGHPAGTRGSIPYCYFVRMRGWVTREARGRPEAGRRPLSAFLRDRGRRR